MDTAIQRWNRLCRLVNDKPTVGVDGVRDDDHPCAAFVLGKPQGDCSTDGHYMCDECTERASCDRCGERPMYCACDAPRRYRNESASHG